MITDNKQLKILKVNYKRVLEKSFVIALLMMGMLFYLFPIFDVGTDLKADLPEPIKPINIPPTRHPEKRIKPDKPVVPVATEEEELLEMVEIDFLQMQENWLLGTPEIPEDDTLDAYEFYAVSDKPVLVKRVEPYYPELARKAHIEGMVLVKVLINTTGDIEDAQIVKSVPMLDQAAIDAAKKFKFTPGKQRDRYVRVWMQIPFRFNLR